MTDYKQLCAELLQELESAQDGVELINEPRVNLINRARAELATPESQEEPPSPKQGQAIKDTDTGMYYVRDGDQWLVMQPVTNPAPISDAFAVVQKRLDQLAGDQEPMIYRWPNLDFMIDFSNPSTSQPIPVSESQPEPPTDEKLLETFYTACLSEGGTSDEINLRGLRAVLAR